MNNVDGIFSAEVGIQINVPVIEVFTSDCRTIRFRTNSTAGCCWPKSRLTVRIHSHKIQHAAGLTHMWTGQEYRE